MSAPTETGLVISPHPLTLEGRQVLRAAELRPGETLVQFLERHEVDLAHGEWVVSIGGAQVSRLMWSRTRPRHGQLVECRRVAGRQVLTLVAVVFVAWVTMGGGLAAMGVGAQAGMSAGAIAASGVGGLAGALGMSAGFAALVVNAGAMMLGAMVVNKLLAPPRPRMPSFEAQTVSQTYSVSGGRNAKRPYEPLPVIFGQLRVVPDYATDPYTWFNGDDQYQYVRLHAGINCGRVDELRIGSTDITSYTDVTVSRSGFPGSTEQLTDWSNVDSIAGGTLDGGGYVTRTSSAGAVALAVDVGASLYKVNDDGSMARADVVIEVQYRQTGTSGSWLPFFGSTAGKTLTSYKTSPLRRTFEVKGLAPGQYDVRMRKLTANVSSTREANGVEWGTLRSYQRDNGNYSRYPQVGISIKAGGQINGALDAVNWLATAQPTAVWTGSAWVYQETSNPGAQILQFARGLFDDDGRLQAGLGLPDSQIDIEGLKAFTLHCAAGGYRFDAWLDQPMSCEDVLNAMAAAGQGTIGWPNGKLSVLYVHEDQPLEAVVNMANIKKGSFRVDYATRALAEELEISWLDRDAGYVQRSLRVQAPDVSGVPRDTARMAPIGITTEAGALRQARFTMAQSIYQRKSVTWEMDLEALTFRRFSRIALSHDLTAWGQGGRLRAVAEVGGVVTLQLDEPVKPALGATAWYVGLRLPGSTSYQVLAVAPVTAETDTLTLMDAWPSGVPLPGNSPANPAHDTLWIFDFKADPGQHLLVTGIEPFSNLSGARVTAVPVGDEFWDYVNTGAYMASPAPPAAVALAASNVQVTQDRLALTYDAQTQLTVTFNVVGSFDHAQVWAAPVGQALQYLGLTRTSSYSGWTVATAGNYLVEVRPFDALGRQGQKASNVKTVEISTPIAQSNLINVGWWKQDASIPWAPNGEYNRLVNTAPAGGADLGIPGPRGGNDTVWYCKEQTGDGEQGGGWDAQDTLTLDPTRAYRF
ncbi:MAG: host specificity factor TipJ family phage tail protein, partial [Roseateles sp.]